MHLMDESVYYPRQILVRFVVDSRNLHDLYLEVKLRQIRRPYLAFQSEVGITRKALHKMSSVFFLTIFDIAQD